MFNEYYYDAWSNMHYGYVSTRCGFDEKTLQSGAASGFPGAGTNDVGDVISVKIGIDLWHKHGTSLGATDLCNAITSNAANYRAARTRELNGGERAHEAAEVVITDNDYK